MCHLDQPWVYTGLKPLLWELRITNNASAADYGNDFQTLTGSTSTLNSGTVVGTGCIATGQATAMALTTSVKNQFIRFRIGFGIARAVVSSPVLVMIAGSNSNLPVPGLCTSLIAMPILLVSIGTADATGAITEFAIANIPAAGLVGGVFFAPALCPDFGQGGIPVALSNGRQSTFPAPAATPARVTRVYGYRLTATSMRAPSVWTGRIVTLLD
jgi:hypothetical protein